MATRAQGLETLPAYTALVWQQFEANPHLMYNLFQSTVRPGGRTYHSDVAMDMTSAKFSTELSEIKVNTVEDLHRVTNDLLNMPILFRTKVEHTRTDHYVVMKVRRKWKDEFAVLVNTRHPAIREHLSMKLSEAMAYMQEGKSFCLKLGFGSSLRNWYSGVVDAQSDGCDSRSNSDSGHMNIYITNKSTPAECCMNPVCIVCCFPFWLLCCGPCYCIHRKATVIDFDHRFTDLQVTMITGVPYQVTVTRIYEPQGPQGQGHYPLDGQGQMQSGYPQPPQSVIPPPQGRVEDPRAQPGYGYDQGGMGWNNPETDEPPPAYPGLPNK